MGIMEGTGGLKTWKGTYDFTRDGGGTGTYILKSNDGDLPAGSVIMGGVLDVTIACLSGTGTMAIHAEGAADLLAATAQAGLTLGRKSLIPVFTGATTVKTTVRRAPTMTIATNPFTAGAFTLHLAYV